MDGKLNRRGSALTMVIVLAGILSVVLSAGLTVANRMQGETKGLASKLETAKLANYIEANLENPTICLGLGAASGSPLQGLQFYPAGIVQDDMGNQVADQFKFNTSLVNGDPKAQQMVAFSSTLKEGLIRNGVVLSQYGVTVHRFYISNVNRPSGSTSIQADVWAQFSAGTTLYKEQRLGTIYLGLNGTQLASCQMQMAAKDVCESMSCTWNDTAPPGVDPTTFAKCVCQIPDLSCPGVDNGYVHGYDPVRQVAICKSAAYACSQPGSYFSGFDGNGAPICTVAYSVAPPTGPSPPTGTSPTAATSPLPPSQPTCSFTWQRFSIGCGSASCNLTPGAVEGAPCDPTQTGGGGCFLGQEPASDTCDGLNCLPTSSDCTTPPTTGPRRISGGIVCSYHSNNGAAGGVALEYANGTCGQGAKIGVITACTNVGTGSPAASFFGSGLCAYAPAPATGIIPFNSYLPQDSSGGCPETIFCP